MAFQVRHHQSPEEAKTFSDLALESCAQVFQDRLGIIGPPRYLGSGFQGSTYQMTRSKIMKITPAESEAQVHLALKLMQASVPDRVPGMMPYVYDAFALGQCAPTLGPTGHYYVIVREDLAGLPEVLNTLSIDEKRAISAVIWLLVAGMENPTPKMTEGLLSLSNATTDLSLKPVLDEAGKLIFWMHQANLSLSPLDTKPDHFGFRRTAGKVELVLRDMGYVERYQDRGGNPLHELALPQLQTLGALGVKRRRRVREPFNGWVPLDQWRDLSKWPPRRGRHLHLASVEHKPRLWEK